MDNEQLCLSDIYNHKVTVVTQVSETDIKALELLRMFQVHRRPWSVNSYRAFVLHYQSVFYPLHSPLPILLHLQLLDLLPFLQIGLPILLLWVNYLNHLPFLLFLALPLLLLRAALLAGLQRVPIASCYYEVLVERRQIDGFLMVAIGDGLVQSPAASTGVNALIVMVIHHKGQVELVQLGSVGAWLSQSFIKLSDFRFGFYPFLRGLLDTVAVVALSDQIISLRLRFEGILEDVVHVVKLSRGCRLLLEIRSVAIAAQFSMLQERARASCPRFLAKATVMHPYSDLYLLKMDFGLIKQQTNQRLASVCGLQPFGWIRIKEIKMYNINYDPSVGIVRKQTISLSKSIDFSILSPADILHISKAEVNNFQLYAGPLAPVPNGPIDSRLGVGTKLIRCNTCGEDLQMCVGHFGHSKLSLPIYHIGYFKHLIVVLKMVCKYCFKVLLEESELKAYTQKMKKIEHNYIARSALFKKIFKEASKNLKCPHCQRVNPVIQKIAKVSGKIEVKHPMLRREILDNKIQRGTIESAERKGDDLVFELNPWQARKIIMNIPKQQWILVNVGGGTEVKDFIIDHLVIPPMCIRPSIMLTNSLSNEDDLTIKIKEIVFLNKKIFEGMIQKGDDMGKIAKAWYLMQSHWSQYINSDSPGLPLQELKQKYIRSFCTRLKGKQGRFRQNLSGKRSNYTARTVISPDPNIRPDQVIVPQFMARILTIKETVNQHSINFLRECVERGSFKRGGANFIITKDGEKLAINAARGKIQLRMGDVVERHLRDGDIVIFNRQPSLHRISMMGFKVKVSEGKTLRFNECVCTPFNADFDGDEMNIHVPQTIQARSQTLHLMGVTQNIVTPKSGQPIIALIQDFLTTSFLITSRDVFFTRQQFTEILSWFTDANEFINLPPPTILKPATLWTGKQVISAVLRPNRLSRVVVNFSAKEKIYSRGQYACIRDGWVLFKNSELLLGQIGKTTLGGNKTGLIYHLLRDNTNQVACEIMHRIGKLSARWLSNYGMTIGISDVTPSSDLKVINKGEIQNAYGHYHNYLSLYKKGQLQAKPGMSVDETLESLLNSTLSKVRETVGDNCIKHLDRYNKPLIMALCGSKGSAVNLSQMIGCVGQQTVGGKRITYGFTQRSLPHFSRLLETPQARGFVKNSFFSGLTATEFFFHTMGGRQGIIDTAVKTADTGYMQRRLIKLIEDVGVMYDYTVRTCDRKQIIQFRYGDDGLDPMKCEQNKNPVNLKCQQQYVKNLLGTNLSKQRYLTPQEIVQQSQEYIDKIVREGQIVGLDQTFQHTLLERLRKYFQQKSNNLAKDYARIKCKDQRDQIYLKNSFHGITDLQLKLFFNIYIKKINRCIIEPGEAIGALTAQSIGQPATQMTLKTFHFAGISSMNITQGVPRVNEIINNTKNIATPIITIYLEEASKDSAVAVKNKVEKLTLGRILHSIEQIYGLAECSLNVILNTKMMEEFQIRLSAEDVKRSIDSSLKSKIKKSEVTSYNTINIVAVSKTNIMFELKSLRRKLSNVVIGGITTINRALISKENEQRHIIYAEGLGLKKVLTTEGVDPYKSFSNHITQIQECLGIEAAKQSIINQITQTMKQHGVNVNPRHINLLSEVMTCKGRIIGFTRNGVDKMKDSTIMLASFQKTTDFLFDAATMGKHDRMRGVSEKIIMGQPITVGTGMFDIRQEIKSSKVYGA